MLLELFGETQQPTEDCNNPKCCDVFELKANAAGTETDLTEEFTILHNAISGIGNKGELKLAQWIRGSTLAWTNEYNNKSCPMATSRGTVRCGGAFSYAKCHVLGLVNKELKS